MSSRKTMEKHALAILEQEYLWYFEDSRRIQQSGEQGGQFHAVAYKLLYHLIDESEKLGGKVLEMLWYELGTCNEKLSENRFEAGEFHVNGEVLFRGLSPWAVDFGPVLVMAAEYFTHLGVAFMNPGGRKSGTSTDYSVTESINENVDLLLEIVDEEGDFGKRKRGALKELSLERDGPYCLLTHWQFKPFKYNGVQPALAHIIPNSIHGKPNTLKCITMFAGKAVADDVAKHLNRVGNVVNMERNAYDSYDDLDWGIEAVEEGGKFKYIFRTISSPTRPSLVPEYFALKDGDKIQFGKGRAHREKLGDGLIPTLCNLQLAVARVLKMNATADIILKWEDNADDDGCSHLFIAGSEGYCDILDAKLLLTGRAEIAV